MFAKKKQNKIPPIVDQLLLQPASKLSKQIKDGSLTATRLCELYAERMKLVNPIINAMCQERFEAALEEARQIDQLLAAFRSGRPEAEFSPEELERLRSPLLGVPITVKESIMVEGMKNSCGIWSRRDSVASEDAVVVRNARRLGLIPLATTNIPECTLYWADCQNKVYGRSLNPYDLGHITGASSGGEASIQGAGASVMGIGSDIGGSLRIPAHFCGIYSHKPSPFLLSPEGNFPHVLECRLRLFTLGPMCRYASDLKPLLKCLMSDGSGNAKQDSYHKYQPENIGELRQMVLKKLDEPVDLSQIKFYYFNFNQSPLKGKHSVHVPEEFMAGQQEVLDHFRSKFNCQTATMELDKYLKMTMIVWQCMLLGAGTTDRDVNYVEDELKKTFGIESLPLEFIKMPLGLSKHTKESLLAIMIGNIMPKDREKAYALCEKFENLGKEMRAEVEAQLGDSGVLIMPTLPNVAYKHNVSLLKTPDLRFPALFNVLQLPVSHAHLRLNRKNKLPFGFSIASKPYNDSLTLAVAEEIELTFGGWTQPSADLVPQDVAAMANSKAAKTESGNVQQQQQQQQQEQQQQQPIEQKS